LQLLKEYENLLKAKKILSQLEVFKNWDEFLQVLFKRFKGTIVFDEFQNFREVEPAIFGLFQKYIDLNENRKGLLIVFLGSNIGLMKKTFEAKKSPLFGRIKRKIFLKPLELKEIIEFSRHLKIKKKEDVFTLYAIFGGYPKYYVSIEDEKLEGRGIKEILTKFFFQENALLEDEINNILSLEFGRRKGIYYDMLLALSQGCNQLKDISAFLNKRQTSISRQFNELLNYFELIGYRKIFPSNKKIYYIKHPLINFWFRFFYQDLSSYSQRSSLFFSNFKTTFNTFLGRRFEDFCYQVINDMNKEKSLELSLDEIGKGILYKREAGERRTYEIDILGIARREKIIAVVECKWKENVNPNKILKNLREKAEALSGFEKWEKYYLIFAKSFSSRTKLAHCISLNDIFKFYQIPQ
jgi:hypothetical protein